MPTIDFYTTATHYLDHMAPVWKALLKRNRGTFYVSPDIRKHAEEKGVANLSTEDPPSSDNLTLVAGSGNLNTLVRFGRPNRAIMEHGCGLSYGGDTGYRGRIAATSASYAGGDGRLAQLFLHPGEHPAARDRARYPDATVEVVGCPKLDTLPKRVPDDGPPVVAVSFHWDSTITTETRSAFIFYREHVKRIAREVAKSGEFRLIGHAHPRAFRRLESWYTRYGIEAVRDFEEVCRRADIYAVDNSSTLYEFASTGRQVIVLNAPFYRKRIHHGLRFWDAIPGPQVDEPADLMSVIRYELAHPTLWDERREAAVDRVYGFRKGAAKRAAKVLESFAEGL